VPSDRRLIIGVGNEDRGDDGVGRIVARRLRGRVPNEWQVVEQDGEASRLLDLLKDAHMVHVVDAAAPGAAPGTIMRLDARATRLPPGLFALSSHGFGVAEAIELARVMNFLPLHCIVYAIEGGDFTLGAGLAPPVAAAADEVQRRILRELEEPVCA
jgi:hydrogenase maturation protease